MGEGRYAKMARKAMFAPVEGVYSYGLCRVCPLTTPGVGVGEDIPLVSNAGAGADLILN
jgi:hypothetical protein